jgi:hypothetical protein
VLLTKKAEELGISQIELQKMIDAQIKGQTYEPVISKNAPPVDIPEIKVHEETIVPNVLKQSVKKEVITEPIKKEDISPVSEVKNEIIPPVIEIKKEEIVIPEALKEKKIVVPEKKKEVVVTPPEIIQKPEKEVITTHEEKKTTSTPPQKNTETAPPSTGGKSKMLPIIAIGVVVALLVVLGFVFKDKIFGGHSDSDQDFSDDKSQMVNADDMYKKFMEAGKTAFAGSEYLKSKNNFDSALVYKKADADATSWSSKIQTILTLLNEANELFKNKNIARAEMRYDSLLKFAPDEKTAAENIVKCREIIGKAANLKAKKSENEGKFGFEDADGNIVIDFVFMNAKDYFGKLAAVQNSANKWGLIGEDYPKTKKTVVDFKFDNVQKQSPGYSCRINGDDHYYAFFLQGGKLVERKY